MSVLVIKINILVYLVVFDKLADWKVIYDPFIPVAVCFGWQDNLYWIASPTLHSIIEDSFLLANDKSITFKPWVFDKFIRFIFHMKKGEFSSDRSLLKAAANTRIVA